MRPHFLLFGSLFVVLFVNLLHSNEFDSSPAVGAAISEEKTVTDRGGMSLGARASLGVESNAYVWGSRDHEASSTASGEISLEKDSLTLRARLAGSRIHDQYEEWKWAEDFRLSLSRRAYKLSKSIGLAPSLSLTLPMTEQSRKYSLLKQGVSAGLTMSFDLKHVLRGLDTSVRLTGSHYQYQIPVSFNGVSNEAWRAHIRWVTSYEFADGFSAELLFGRIKAWTVGGKGLDRFEMDQSLSAELTDYASLSVGHNRGGNVLRSDGNSNLALYDARDANFYLSLDLEI